MNIRVEGSGAAGIQLSKSYVQQAYAPQCFNAYALRYFVKVFNFVCVYRSVKHNQKNI